MPKIKEVFQRTLEITGFRKEKYDIAEQQLSKGQFNNPVYFSVYDGKGRFIKTEGPYPELNIGSRIGSKRFWGRLEWIIGINCALTGLGFEVNALLSDIPDTGGQRLLGLGLITLGSILARDGRKRRDIASSIIDKLN